jgi:hypothetical protein
MPAPQAGAALLLLLMSPACCDARPGQVETLRDGGCVDRPKRLGRGPSNQSAARADHLVPAHCGRTGEVEPIHTAGERVLDVVQRDVVPAGAVVSGLIAGCELGVADRQEHGRRRRDQHELHPVMSRIASERSTRRALILYVSPGLPLRILPVFRVSRALSADVSSDPFDAPSATVEICPQRADRDSARQRLSRLPRVPDRRFGVPWI